MSVCYLDFSVSLFPFSLFRFYLNKNMKVILVSPEA